MSSQKSPPVVTLCKDDPRFPFSGELLSVWRRGKFTHAAIAFLTDGGVKFFVRNCLKIQDHTRCRLCLTVQWPTNLDEVARQLSPLLGPNLKIHLSAKTANGSSAAHSTRMLASQGGLGIGLSLVRQLLERHGGSITATSPGLHQGSEWSK
jgi:hypothetical protein